MLTLRAKLLLGFGGLFFFLVMMAGVTLYSNMRHEALQREFMDRGFTHVQDLRHAERGIYRLGRAALVASLTHPVDWPRIDAADALVRTSLDREIAGSDPAAASDLRNARAAYDAWVHQLRTMLKLDDVAQRNRLFARTVAPGQQLLLLKIDSALTRAMLTMRNLSEASRSTAVASYYVAGALAISGLIFGAFFIRMLARHILTPLRALTHSAGQIQRGEMPDMVQAQSRDDLGQLAQSFNAMITTIRQLRDADARRLHRTEAATQLAINSLPHAVALLSPEGRVELANSAAESLFGLKSGMALGEIQQKRLVSLVEQVIQTRRRVDLTSYDAAIQIFDNTRELFFLPNAIPLLDSAGGLVGITVVLADVTQLRQVDEAKSGLLSALSHELKTPLTSIQMSIHLLLEDAASRLAPRQLDLLATARDDADRLHSLITSLLDKRREAPSGPPDPA